MINKKGLWIFGLAMMMGSVPNVFGQTRLIPHITSTGGGFETEIIIGNYTEFEQKFTLTAYNLNGEKIATINDATLDPNTTFSTTPDDLFKIGGVSHFLISNDSKVIVSAAYQAQLETAGPVHVLETGAVGFVFRIFMGDINVTWDGIAVVNLGNGSAQVTIRQRDKDGNQIDIVRDPFNGSLPPNGKGLIVLSSSFESVQGASLEIQSNEPITLMSLRGTHTAEFIWQNAAILVE